MAIKRAADDAENSMMLTDLFAALFIVMLLAVGTTPAVKKAAVDRNLTTEIPDKQPLYLYASINGALHFSHALDRAIPLASLSSVLKKRIDSHKLDTVIIVFPKDAKASQMDDLIDKVENASDLTVTWTWL